MPLSRQTSRIVWPSKPSTTRPSTSMRIRGVLCGPLRRLRRDEPLGEGVLARRRRVVDARGVRTDLAGTVERRLGTDDEVGHQRDPAAVAPAPTAIGVQTPAGQVERRRWSSSSDRKYRIALVNGRVARRSWSHSAEAAMSCARSASGPGSVGFGVPLAIRSPISYSRRRPMRHGMDLPQAASAGELRQQPARSTMHGRSSAITTEPEPTWAPASRSASNSYGVSSRSGGQEAAGRSADEDGLERRGRRCRRRARTSSRSGRAQRDLGDAATLGAAQLDEDRCPGWPSRRSRRTPRRRCAMIHGTAARVWTLLTTVGLSNRPRLGRVRRTLVGLAALALEGLEQDRLLAQHVGALDRADRRPDAVTGAQHVLAQEARLLGREDRALEPRRAPGRPPGRRGSPRSRRWRRPRSRDPR